MYAYVNKHRVAPGETLYGIAKRIGLSPRQLLYINSDITNPNLIYAGQIINVPEERPLTTYFVKPGNTLWRIIQNYNSELMRYYGNRITLNEVLAYNPAIMYPDLIFPGDIIYLPKIL